MSRRFERQYAMPGVIADRLRGIVFEYGSGAPTNGVGGFAPGCIYVDITNGNVYRNSGTATSTTWDQFTGSVAGGALTVTHLTIADGGTVISTTGNGTKIGTAANQKLGFFNATPVVQPSGSGETAGVGAGTPDTNTNLAAMNFTGNVGNRAYTIGDIVKCLKNLGFLQVSS